MIASAMMDQKRDSDVRCGWETNRQADSNSVDAIENCVLRLGASRGDEILRIAVLGDERLSVNSCGKGWPLVISRHHEQNIWGVDSSLVGRGDGAGGVECFGGAGGRKIESAVYHSRRHERGFAGVDG